MTLEELNPELFIYELYDSCLLHVLDDALYCAAGFGYCDTSRLAVRPRTGLYALMITWQNGEKNWCHVDARQLNIIRKRLARREEKHR